MSRKLVLFSTLLVIFFNLTLAGYAASAASLKGTYVFLGARDTTSYYSHAIGSVGYANFDGKGKVAFTMIQKDSKNGVAQSSASGTYSVTASGFATMSGGPAGYVSTYTMVLSGFGTDGVATVLYGTSSGGGVNWDKAVLQSAPKAGFTASSVSGNYAFRLTTMQEEGSVVAQETVGMLSFDGKGKVSFVYTRNSNQTLKSFSATSTYTVASSGVGKIAASSNVAVLPMTFILHNGGQGLCLLDTDSSMTVGIGDATHQ